MFFRKGQRYLVIVDEHRKLFSYGITIANNESEAIVKIARQFNDLTMDKKVDAGDVVVVPLKPRENPDARFEAEVANRGKA